MIVLVCVALLATICAGQNGDGVSLYRSYNPELWPKLPKGARQEYLKLRPDHVDWVQQFSFPRAFQCLDANEDSWPDDVKICIAEITDNGRSVFYFNGSYMTGPRGEKLGGAGDIDPKYGLCALHEMVTKCFIQHRVTKRCGPTAQDFAEVLLLTPSQKPAKVQESCHSKPDDESEMRKIGTSFGFGRWGSILVPVRRRFVLETPRHVQQCLGSNYPNFHKELDSCKDYENRTQKKDYDYELCLWYGMRERCYLAAVEEHCGTEGVLNTLDHSMSGIDFRFWASCTLRPAYVYTDSPPGVKFLD